MKQRHKTALACLCMVAGIGHARAANNDPTDANASVHPAIYRSPFADYRRLGDDQVTPWRQANDSVAAIGGWRAYAREAAAAAKAREAIEAAKNKSTPPPGAAPVAPTPPLHKHGG
jgi:hypothetical protein